MGHSQWVKFGFLTGYNLVFAAFQPNGTGRGLENQPLYEIVPVGYYRAEPAIALEDGDVVLAYELETVLWDDEIVVYLTYDYVFYEGKQVYYEGDWVMDLDNTYNDVVHWTGDVVGSGEYIFGTGDISELVDDVETLVAQQGTVVNVYDETGNGAEPQVLTALGNVGVSGRGDC